MVLLQISKKERQLSLLKKKYLFHLASSLYKTAVAVIFGSVPKSF